MSVGWGRGRAYLVVRDGVAWRVVWVRVRRSSGRAVKISVARYWVVVSGKVGCDGRACVVDVRL